MATHTINRVAIYARVSTTNHGQDVSMQMRELRDYCERRGWTVAGTKDRRPELDRLMTDAHKRRFDVVAVWKFDRRWWALFVSCSDSTSFSLGSRPRIKRQCAP